MKLHNWQQEAIDKWKESNYSGIIEVPTGAGKTLLGIKCMLLLRKNTLIICPTIPILKQWKSELIKNIPNIEEKIG